MLTQTIRRTMLFVALAALPGFAAAAGSQAGDNGRQPLGADNETPRRLYAAIEVGGLLVSDDGGRNWAAAMAGLDDPDVHQILPSEKSKGLVVAACGEGVYRSQDRGDHWEKVTPDGPRTFGSAVMEDGAGTIYLGIALGRPNTWLRKERADAAVYASKDGGAHWLAAVEGLSGGVMAMCAGIDGQGVFASTSEGDVLSVDASGARRIISGLPSITAIAVTPSRRAARAIPWAWLPLEWVTTPRARTASGRRAIAT